MLSDGLCENDRVNVGPSPEQMYHSGWQSLGFPLNFAANLKLFEKKIPKNETERK